MSTDEPAGRPDRRHQGALFGVAVIVSGIFLIDLCDLIFGCGCRPLWSGAAEVCNIHHATPPHCPWCAHPLAGGAVAWLAATSTQAVTSFGFPRLGWGVRVALVLAGTPIVVAAVGGIQGLVLGYWS